MLELDKYKDQIAKCSHCSFCQATCPVYTSDMLETHVARARVELINAALLENTIPVTKRLREILNRCLLCTNCTQTCPCSIPVDEIIIAAKHQLYEEKPKDAVKRRLMHEFMRRRGFSGLLGVAESLARKMNLTPDELPVPASKRFESMYKDVVPAEGETRARVAYYVGCATNSFYPETARDTLRVLTRNGIEVILPEGLMCCGLPAMVQGDLATAQEMVRNNITALSKHEVDAIVVDCTSCGMMLKEKAHKILPEDDPLFLQQVVATLKVWEVTDYLNTMGLVSTPDALPEKFTYHVPCHRGWTDTINDAPRAILDSIPKAELVDMEHPERCCGAGGTFHMEYRDLSEDIRSKKIEDITQTEAKTVITQCPSCRSYLSSSLKNHRVMHPMSLLAKAYGL